MLPIAKLSEFSSVLSFADLPDTVREHALWVLADTIGAIAGGSAEPALRRLAQAHAPDDAGRAPLVGLGRSASPMASALVNGTAGTFMELDEGNGHARGHPAVHAIPAAIAMAAQVNADAGTFLSGVVAGYEVGARVGASSRMRKDMHPHGTWGTLGATASAARILGAAPDKMAGMLSVASSLTLATSKQTMLQGALVRNVYSGLSNQNGLLAVELHECGFDGEADGLGSVFGKVVAEGFDGATLISGLGTEWYITRNYFKMHACCRYNHGALDAIDLLASRGELPLADEIESVEISTYDLAAEMSVVEPQSVLGSKFSVPFAVATRLIRGHTNYRAFTDETIRDPRTLALARKVRLAVGDDMTLGKSPARPARVTVRSRKGRETSAEVSINRGEPALPYSREALGNKFLEIAARAWPDAHCRTVLDATLSLGERSASMQNWTKLLLEKPARR